MGWRGRGGGWSRRWSGRGPFSHLPPWQRPGWIYGSGRGFYGYGRPYGYRYSRPYSCAKFPWLPRGWWADSRYQGYFPYPPPADLNAEIERLEAEREALTRSMEELKKHVEEGTRPTTWPPTLYSAYALPGATPGQERQFLEQQRDWITNQMDSIKKRLEEIKKEE